MRRGCLRLSLAERDGAGLYLGPMRQHRPILALGLCLLLALTSQSLAVARGAAQPVGEIVLCTGTGPVTVTVDGEGQPVVTPHLCPDCLPGFAVVLEARPALTEWRAPARRLSVTIVISDVVTRSLPAGVARAPPLAA
ncbi:hypothetical protein ACSSVY_002365 [Roseovarius sp. MBR-51]